MDELFGVPTQQLTRVLLGAFAASALILVVLAARDRTSFTMAVRNVPRRKTQTALIVTGLMLATLLFSAAFTTGNRLTNSLRAQALENIGRVDVIVRAEQPEPGSGAPFGPGAGRPEVTEARERYFRGDLVGRIRDRLADEESVAGAAPLAKETVPVTSPQTNLSEPQVDVLGVDADYMQSFDRPKTASGGTLALGDLEENEIYLSAKAAGGLGVSVGDKIEASLIRPTTEPRPETPSEPKSQWRPGASQGHPGAPATGSPPAGFEGEARPPDSTGEARAVQLEGQKRSRAFVVAGVYESGANPASGTSMVMPLKVLQRFVGEEGRVNEVLISHRGPSAEGGRYTDTTVDKIRPILSANGLQADPVKKDAVEEADRQGELFSTLLVLFGQFSVSAGMLLIFVMLAAERKKELGIAHAVGMQRSSLVRAFAFEGALYALLASAVGSALGVGVGWLMVRLIGRGLAGGSEDFRIAFAASPEDVVLAFCMGMVLTFIVVLISSWRVSRLNVVRAIRDIPEPDRKGHTVLGVIVALLTPLAGGMAFWQGLATETMAFYLGGISLVLIGAALLARVFGLPDRAAFTVSGLTLLALWLTPVTITAPARMAKGPEMFFVSGIAIVVAGVWLVVFNADVLLWLVVATFGRMRGLPRFSRPPLSTRRRASSRLE